MQKLIPANCPIELPEQALAPNPGIDTLFAVAIGAEEHNNAVNDALMPFGERLSLRTMDKAVGHTACASCMVVEQCQSVIKSAEVIAPEIKHPLQLRNELDPKSVTDLWALSIVAQAEHSGYTRESCANMVGNISKLASPLKNMIIKVLESDSTHIPTQIGKIELDGKKYEVVDFGDARLVISQESIEALSENGAYKDGFIDTLSHAFLRTESHNHGGQSVVARLRASMETNNFKGLGIKPLKSMPPLREFNGGAHSSIRGFGVVMGRQNNQADSVDTIVINHVAEVKGGEDSTQREGARALKAVQHLSAEDIKLAVDSGQRKGTLMCLQRKIS